MAEFQTTYWRELPSLVVAKSGAEVAKVSLPARFQEAIDEAAMRWGAVDSDAYLAGWRRSDWQSAEGSPAEVADEIAARLEREWPPDAVAAFLAGLSPATGASA